MALDFPTSPTDGQVYDNWIYSSTKGAWEAKPLTAGVATPSPTAPLAPKQGDLWYNTEDGNTYVWYTDFDGSQWVQLKSDATLSSTLGTRVDSLEATRPGTTGIPFRQAAGIATGNGTSNSNSGGWFWNQQTTVTLPVGRFTQAPIINLTYNAVDTIGFATLSGSAPTTTSFIFVHLRLGAYPPSYPVHWSATQMTSTSGAG